MLMIALAYGQSSAQGAEPMLMIALAKEAREAGKDGFLESVVSWYENLGFLRMSCDGDHRISSFMA